MTDESARQRGAEGDPREHARALIDEKTRRVPDFPEKGIIFQDLSPVLADGDGLASVVDGLIYGLGDVDLVGGIDARGFLIGGAVALRLGVGVLAIRKAGKLPPPTHRREYELEYGTASLELPADGMDLVGKRVLVVDDVLATGGTAIAAVDLLTDVGAEVVAVATIMELDGLGGHERVAKHLGGDIPVTCLWVG
ncbi:adenine phosphoribosyltransferase [Gordonia jinhuaensis]|uniref:Adenine phosphoribosyltransferase n=1 Tax=Gordonia jinhuaensis TaxID=1517702 RepID=A0A916WYD2_9ACTN|nr:adenine phosphoribosyltransferase [Gordonia jinhuaensis]GGB43410.1 adenine phosphoribosyltransferase [Gordonia jinhuaensis]